MIGTLASATFSVAGDGSLSELKLDLQNDPISYAAPGIGPIPIPKNNPAAVVGIIVSAGTATASLNSNGRFVTVQFSSAPPVFDPNQNQFVVTIFLLYPSN